MKNEVRDIALRAGLPSARRRDSQGICFLGKIDYNDFVRRFLGEREGDIVELETGRKLGKHRGYCIRTRTEERPRSDEWLHDGGCKDFHFRRDLGTGMG